MQHPKPPRPPKAKRAIVPILAGLTIAVGILDVCMDEAHDWIPDGLREAIDAASAATRDGGWSAEAHASAVLSIETVIVGQGPTGAEVEPGEAKTIARGLATLAGVIVRAVQAGRA